MHFVNTSFISQHVTRKNTFSRFSSKQNFSFRGCANIMSERRNICTAPYSDNLMKSIKKYLDAGVVIFNSHILHIKKITSASTSKYECTLSQKCNSLTGLQNTFQRAYYSMEEISKVLKRKSRNILSCILPGKCILINVF